MAYVKEIDNKLDDAYDIMLVSDSVGKNAANWWTDIQLVQYLIGNIYDYAARGAGDWKQQMSKSELESFPDPNTDFKALSRTAAVIKRFQLDSAKQGITLYPDGRVDKANGVRGSISNTVYTILVANEFFASAIWEGEAAEDPVEWALNDWFMPETLKGQLRKSMDNGQV